MTDRTLDVALRIGADLDQAVKEVSALDGALDGIKTSGKSAASGLDATAASASKGASALKSEATAATAAATANAKLGASATATAAAQHRMALTAGELRNAQRQLPSQITDIVTGLISGQPVYMVAIQQGGQLKDAWGGVGNAARALVSAISPTIVAVSAGAAAFAAIGIAAYQGYQEVQGFERGLISTGNSAGTTAGQLADMADRVGGATGEYHDAADAALQLAESGKISGSMMEAATSAAVNLAKLTGDSIESTTEKVIKLAAAPSAQLAELNQQYHFLSVSVYEHVRALEDQGQAEEAAKVAVEEFARVHEARVREAEERAGALERGWHSLGTTIAGIWDGLKDLGRTDAEYRLQAAQDALGRMRENYGAQVARGLITPQQLADQEKLVASLQAEVEATQAAARAHAGVQAAEDFSVKVSEDARKKKQQEVADAKRGWDQREIGDLTKKGQLEAKIAEIRAQGALLHKSDAEVEAQITRARQRYQESLGKPKETDAQKAEAAAQRELQGLQQQTAMLGAIEDGEKRASEEARIRYEINQGAYRLASGATKEQLLAQAKAKDAALDARDAQEKQRREVEDTKRAYERLHAELETPIEAAVSDVTAQIETLNKSLALGPDYAARYRSELEKIGNQSLSPAPSMGNLLGQFGIGDPDADRLSRANASLENWFTEQLAIINAGREASQGANDLWDQKEADARAAHFTGMTQLAIAQNQLQLEQVSSIFGSMAQIAKSFVGEQSKTYQVLFALSKGFAVAQLATSLAINVSKASEKGFPENLGLIAAAFAQGAQIAGILAGANYTPQGYMDGGRIFGPGSGTSDSVPIRASNGEYMVRHASASQPGAYAFLEDFNRRGMGALNDWRGFAEGGLITTAPEPSFRPGAGGSSAVNLQNQMRLYLYQDIDQLRSAILNHPSTEKHIVATVGENGGGIRAEWGN